MAVTSSIHVSVHSNFAGYDAGPFAEWCKGTGRYMQRAGVVLQESDWLGGTGCRHRVKGAAR